MSRADTLLNEEIRSDVKSNTTSVLQQARRTLLKISRGTFWLWVICLYSGITRHMSFSRDICAQTRRGSRTTGTCATRTRTRNSREKTSRR